MTRRIVSIQHGDYREALRIIESGGGEPYFGMAYTLDVLEKLFGDDPHMVISLNAPAYRESRGQGDLVGLPTPKLPRGFPRRLGEYLMARRIMSLIRTFQPTHVLLRTALPVVSLSALNYCQKKNLGFIRRKRARG